MASQNIDFIEQYFSYTTYIYIKQLYMNDDN